MDATFLNGITTVIGGVDGPTSIFIAGKMSMGILIGTIVAGVLVGILGLKLMRVFAALNGLAIGAFIGFAIAGFVNVSETMSLVIVLGCGIVLAVLLCLLKRVGAFMLALTWSFGVVIAFAGLDHMIALIIAIVVSLVFAILAAIFMEPIIIITSAFAGAVSAAPSILMMTGLDSIVWLTYVASVVLAIVFMMIQFMMQSRKIGKKEKVYSAKIKESDSVESEVERLRMLLDDEDEE